MGAKGFWKERRGEGGKLRELDIDLAPIPSQSKGGRNNIS